MTNWLVVWRDANAEVVDADDRCDRGIHVELTDWRWVGSLAPRAVIVRRLRSVELICCAGLTRTSP